MLAALFRFALAVLFAFSLGIVAPGRALAVLGQVTFVEGTVRDAATGAVLDQVCVTLGPPIRCATFTDSVGHYRVEIIDLNITWELNFIRCGYVDQSLRFQSNGSGPYRQDIALQQGIGLPGTKPDPLPGTPTQTVYLPNITKTLGGLTGWQTPFIVQNVSPADNTELEVNFFRFSDGSLVTRRIVTLLMPGTSSADVPNNDCDLPHNSQFSVVVRSFGANVVAVVNEHAGVGARAEAGSYVGKSSGAMSVFLPNIVKRFFGFDTPFIIQNLGAQMTTATASFVSFDGTKTATLSRTIGPGQSQFVDPNFEPALVDGTQYAVTVTAGQPISVVVNTHNDAPEVSAPAMYSINGLTEGAANVYGPYAVKGVPGVGKGVSTIVVQNLSASAAMPTLTFTPLGGGMTTTFSGPSVGPNQSWAFDPRFQSGDVTKPLCGSAAASGCLADGEYSFVASAAGGSLAAVVNVIGATTAAGYTAAPRLSTKNYLPNVTRTLGGADGWTTPIVVQSVSATNLTLSWFRFSDGSLVTTQPLSLTAGSAARVDPRGVPALSDNTQFAVVVDGNGGQLTAIVTELNFQGGDGAMTYEGFPQ